MKTSMKKLTMLIIMASCYHMTAVNAAVVDWDEEAAVKKKREEVLMELIGKMNEEREKRDAQIENAEEGSLDYFVRQHRREMDLERMENHMLLESRRKDICERFKRNTPKAIKGEYERVCKTWSKPSNQEKENGSH